MLGGAHGSSRPPSAALTKAGSASRRPSGAGGRSRRSSKENSLDEDSFRSNESFRASGKGIGTQNLACGTGSTQSLDKGSSAQEQLYGTSLLALWFPFGSTSCASSHSNQLDLEHTGADSLTN